MSPHRARLGAVLVLAALSLVARAAFFSTTGSPSSASTPFYIGDSSQVVAQARSIAGSRLWRDGLPHQDPLAPYLLGCVWRLGGEDMGLARWVQAGLVTLAVLFCFLAAESLMGWRAGFVAAALTAVSFPADAFAATLDAQALYLLVLAVTAFLLLHWHQQRLLVTTLALGVVTGLGCLARATHLSFLPVLALSLWLLGGRGPRALGQALLALCAAALVLTPWCARNSLILAQNNELFAAPRNLYPIERLVLVSFRPALDFAASHNALSDGSYEPDRLRAGRSTGWGLLDPFERHLIDHGYSFGADFMRAHPRRAFELLGARLAQLARGLRSGLTGRNLPGGSGGRRGAYDLVVPQWFGLELVCLLAAGIGLRALGRPGGPLLLVVAAPLLVSCLWWGSARDGAALFPLLAILWTAAGRGLFCRLGWTGRRCPGLWSLALLALALLLAQLLVTWHVDTVVIDGAMTPLRDPAFPS